MLQLQICTQTGLADADFICVNSRKTNNYDFPSFIDLVKVVVIIIIVFIIIIIITKIKRQLKTIKHRQKMEFLMIKATIDTKTFYIVRYVREKNV